MDFIYLVATVFTVLWIWKKLDNSIASRSLGPTTYLESLQYGRWKLFEDILHEVKEKHGIEPEPVLAMQILEHLVEIGQAEGRSHPVIIENAEHEIVEFRRKWEKNNDRRPKHKEPAELDALPEAA